MQASPHDLETCLQLIHMLFVHDVRAVPEELRTCLKYDLASALVTKLLPG